jgi:hypothetical protein
MTFNLRLWCHIYAAENQPLALAIVVAAVLPAVIAAWLTYDVVSHGKGVEKGVVTGLLLAIFGLVPGLIITVIIKASLPLASVLLLNNAPGSEIRAWNQEYNLDYAFSLAFFTQYWLDLANNMGLVYIEHQARI